MKSKSTAENPKRLLLHPALHSNPVGWKQHIIPGLDVGPSKSSKSLRLKQEQPPTKAAREPSSLTLRAISMKHVRSTGLCCALI